MWDEISGAYMTEESEDEMTGVVRQHHIPWQSKVCGSFAFLFRYTKHICYNIHDNVSVLNKGIFILGMENIIIHSVLHLEPFDIIVSVLCNGF